MSIELFPSINNWLREGKSVIVTMGHIGNWEWAGLYLGMQYPGHVCALYKEIKSKSINQFMLRRRSTTVDHLVEVSKMSELIRLIKRKPVLILMIADQNPGNDQGIIWTTFLKKNTAFVSGPETLALKFQMPVVYLNSISTPNGHYQLKFDLITDGNYALPPGEITRLYANALEQNIMLQRTEWLWTHKRWKRNESY